MPIYMGAPNINQFVDESRIVWCKKMNASFAEAIWEEFDLQYDMKTANETLILKFLKSRIEVDDCISEIMYLKRNRTAYFEKLNRPFLIENKLESSIFDPKRAMERIRTLIKLQNSYLFS